MKRSWMLATAAAIAVTLQAGVGCGGDDDSDKSSGPTATVPTVPGTPDEDAAQRAVIAYFLSRDESACTERATENHIRADFDGDLAQCEAVRRNNKLTANNFTLAAAEARGRLAEVRGEVRLTGERFAVQLVKVDGAWKIDRIRGDQ